MSSELEHYLTFAQAITHAAGRLTQGFFSRDLTITDKQDGSPVTEADRQAEALIRQAIEQAFPQHGIYGEEYGIQDPQSGCAYTWFIDPIDGTKSFIHGIPFYTNLLALQRDGETVVGLINCPTLNEQLAAAQGLGCRLNGRPVRVSPVADLQRALLLCSDPRDVEMNAPLPGWRQIWQGCRYVRSWGDAYGHLMVATGRAEIMIDPVVEPYDVAPLPVIMAEAGGVYGDWHRENTIFGRSAISCNAALADLVFQSLPQVN
ncbi:MAG: inositol monophosphatase family protein [Synechococcales cyanobacterium]